MAHFLRFRQFLLSVTLASMLASIRPVVAQSPDEVRQVLDGRRVAPPVERFYELREFRAAWFYKGRPSASLEDLCRVIQGLALQGLDPARYVVMEDPFHWFDSTRYAAEEAAVADVFMTETALRLAQDLRGRVDPRDIHRGWSMTRPEPDLAGELVRAVDAGAVRGFLRSLEPRHAGYERLKAALADYREIADRGGWPAVPHGVVLRVGDVHEAVPALRRRLAATRDLEAGLPIDDSTFDLGLERAVRAFQTRHGLEVDGIVGRQTIAALNVPVRQRIDQIILNLERWRWLPETLGYTYARVNIPGFEFALFEGERIVMRMRAIVGTPATRTPVFSTRITEVVLAPYWYVPRSIELGRILPRLEEDPRYLERNRIRRIASGVLRQDPGPSNPLGRVKFTIPNAFTIGLHDTPDRHLFDRPSCAFSHGCIRLQHPVDLAVYLLRDTDWSRGRIDQAIERWVERTIPLTRPVPLHVLYWTAWVDESGTIHLRNDVYGHDETLKRALAGR